MPFRIQMLVFVCILMLSMCHYLTQEPLKWPSLVHWNNIVGPFYWLFTPQSIYCTKKQPKTTQPLYFLHLNPCTNPPKTTTLCNCRAQLPLLLVYYPPPPPPPPNKKVKGVVLPTTITIIIIKIRDHTRNLRLITVILLITYTHSVHAHMHSR